MLYIDSRQTATSESWRLGSFIPGQLCSKVMPAPTGSEVHEVLAMHLMSSCAVTQKC